MISDNLLTEILNQVYRNTQRLDDMEFPEILNTGGGTGIQDATYLVNSANPNLTNEVVVTAARGALIVGNATPAWAVTAHPGAANRILITDANDALWSANTLDLAGNSVLNGSLTGGGTVATGGFTGTIPATANFAMGAGDLTQATANDATIANHTHAITSTDDGTGIIAATIAAFNAAGQLTASDYFTNDGGQFGISGNELLTVDAAGLFKFTGIAGVTVEDGNYIGVASDVRIKFDSSSGYIDAILGDAAGSDEFRVLDSGGTAVITGDSNGSGYFASTLEATNTITARGNAPFFRGAFNSLPSSGDNLFTLYGSGKVGASDILGGGIIVQAGENWASGSASGTNIDFFVTVNGTYNTRARALRIANSKNVLIGTITDSGYRLDIAAGAMRYAEMTAPSAPAANSVVVFARDDGSGKTELCARFATGAIQVLAAEP